MINDTEHTIFECARWQSYRFGLMSIIATITAANIVRVIIARRENLASVANFVERILRLKKRDFKAAVHVAAA